jgi:hypothetical protein
MFPLLSVCSTGGNRDIGAVALTADKSPFDRTPDLLGILPIFVKREANPFIPVMNTIKSMSWDTQKKGQPEIGAQKSSSLPITNSDHCDRGGPPRDLVAVCDTNLYTLFLYATVCRINKYSRCD